MYNRTFTGLTKGDIGKSLVPVCAILGIRLSLKDIGPCIILKYLGILGNLVYVYNVRYFILFVSAKMIDMVT